MLNLVVEKDIILNKRNIQHKQKNDLIGKYYMTIINKNL